MSTSDNTVIVKLNIGGVPFSTLHGTLTKSKYFSNLLDKESMTTKTIINEGEIFIDRSGDLFGDILYYLRTGSVISNDKKRLISIQKEAEFYQLQEMVDAARCKEQGISRVDQQKLDFRAEDMNFLETSKSNDIAKYIVQKEANGNSTSYQIIGKVDGVPYYGYQQCPKRHGYYCKECSKQMLVLRLCNKKLI